MVLPVAALRLHLRVDVVQSLSGCGHVLRADWLSLEGVAAVLAAALAAGSLCQFPHAIYLLGVVHGSLASAALAKLVIVCLRQDWCTMVR